MGPLSFPGSVGSAELLLFPITTASESDVVVEGGVYKFRLVGLSGASGIEPSELFEVDPDDMTTGRFRPENHVGLIAIVVGAGDAESVTFDVDVHPAKLHHETEYRALLEQVADYAAEAVLQGFAPASGPVAASADEIGELEYRSLAFIAARLREERFLAAVEHIVRAPHRRWVVITEVAPIGRGLAQGSTASRALARARLSRPVPAHLGHLPVQALPEAIGRTRNEVTYDTNPNRFVRFVFQHWQSLAIDLEHRLSATPAVGAGPRRRGLAEARWVIDQCDRLLSSSVMQDVGDLRLFPQGDPVMLRQLGYREVLRAFALGEASMALHANLDDDIFSATKRNIATLYEYWCFLVLVRAVTELCGTPSAAAVFAKSPTGLSLTLSEGSRSQVSWEFVRRDRRMAVDLWFNQTFKRAQQDGVEMASWASSIRPDASLRVRPLSGRTGDVVDPFLDTWVHFDAKFRLDVQSSNVADEDPKSTAKRADLLKMHAYRDLIRRSAGAYVLYPGFGVPQRRMQFHEVLPGIGAFPLRPGGESEVLGLDGLRQFIDETLELTSNQASSNERMQFWKREHTAHASKRIRAVGFLAVPPADELVLIGYVRSDQLPWVLAKRRYNIRGDDRHGSVRMTDVALSARLLLLWTQARGQPRVVGLFERTAPWQVISGAELVSDGYPRRPEATAYLVTGINPVTTSVEALVAPCDALPLPADHVPTAATWEAVARSA